MNELKYKREQGKLLIKDYANIKLVANATLDYNAREAYGRDTTTDIIIDGQGFTLTLNQTNSDWSSIGLKNPNTGNTMPNSPTIITTLIKGITRRFKKTE